MALDLQQRIARVQQKIDAKEAAGKSAAGLQKRLAKLLKRLGAANTAAGTALTLGIASLVIPSGAAPNGGPDFATPPGTSVVGSDAGGGLVWGVTIGSESPTPGDAGANNPATSAPDQGSSSTPASPGAAPSDGGSSAGSSTDPNTGSSSGDSTGGAAGQDTESGGSSGGSAPPPDTDESTADPVTEEGIE